MGKVYRYYTLCRPPMPGGIPKAQSLSARGAAARLFRKSTVLRGERLITAGSLRRRKYGIMS